MEKELFSTRHKNYGLACTVQFDSLKESIDFKVLNTLTTMVVWL